MMNEPENTARMQPETKETAADVQSDVPVLPEPMPEKKGKNTCYAGRVTLGVALIITGVLMTASLFLPELYLLDAAKLAPLVLVLLGAEILITAFRHKTQNVRVGFGLTLFSLVLVFGAAFAAVLPELWYECGPGEWEAQQEQMRKAEHAFYEEVDSTQIDSISFYPDGDTCVESVRVQLAGSCATAQDFAKAALPSVHALAKQGANDVTVHAPAPDDSEPWSIALHGVFSLENITEARIAELSAVQNPHRGTGG